MSDLLLMKYNVTGGKCATLVCPTIWSWHMNLNLWVSSRSFSKIILSSDISLHIFTYVGFIVQKKNAGYSVVKAKWCICLQQIWAALLTRMWIWKKYFYSLNLSVLIHEMGPLEFPPDQVSWMTKKEMCIRLRVRLVLRLPYSTEISSAHCSFLSCSSSHTEKVRRNKKLIFHNFFYKKFILMYKI